MSDLLMVQLSSPEIREYDPIKAGMLWHQDSQEQEARLQGSCKRG
jgi:hypothetical protein